MFFINPKINQINLFYAYIEFAHHRAKLYYGLTTGGLGRRARSSCQYEA